MVPSAPSSLELPLTVSIAENPQVSADLIPSADASVNRTAVDWTAAGSTIIVAVMTRTNHEPSHRSRDVNARMRRFNLPGHVTFLVLHAYIANQQRLRRDFSCSMPDLLLCSLVVTQ